MKAKILGLCVSLFLISLVLPLSGVAVNVNENDMSYRHDPYQDYPGYMRSPYPEFKTQSIPKMDIKHHEILSPTFNTNITEMIQQIDESMILGYIENLTDFGPRVTGTSECYEAGEYIYNEFNDMSLEVRFHNWSYGGYSDRNVEATLYGTNSPNDEIYIICAHYDSVSGSPGADDDGSGCYCFSGSKYLPAIWF